MAHFDHQTLEHLKKLCRIECTAEENEEILTNLSRVLEYVEQLKEVNTENTKTCRYVLRGMLKNRMREDEVKEVLPRDQFLANAPDQIGGMIRVPPVLKPSS
jgi:aspartyl-tRNA(Asn)/glutamyl-tRNA(Gln) amidotransferase subunit C